MGTLTWALSHIMLNRGAIVVIGAACGLIFLIISIYNSRSLNTSLMAKLEETEGEVREAIDNEENCAVKLDTKTDEAMRIKNEMEILQNNLDSLNQENINMKVTISETEEQLVSVQREKTDLVESLTNLQAELQEKEALVQQAQA